MNVHGYLDWPFWPEQRSDEQTRQWWRVCYVPAAADRQLENLYHWFVLAGPPASGKSVALAKWADAEAGDSLLLPYPPERWPGARTAWHPQDPSHLAQMLAVAAQAIAETLQLDPARAAGVAPFQREFLRALLERQGGARRYQRFVLSLPPELRDAYQSVPSDVDFFGGGDTLVAVQALIQELMLLVNALGYLRVVYVVDPPTPLGPAHLGPLGDLFGWLDLTDNPDFVVVAALRDDLLRGSATLARARSRVSLVYTDWTAAECHEVAARHLRQALPEAPADAPLERWLTPEFVARLDNLVAKECGQPNPAAWARLAETALYAIHRADAPLSAPLAAEDFPTLCQLYFSRHVTLRLDPERHGVWRGARLLPLEEKLLRFLQLLHRRKHMVNWDDPDLRQLASSKNNVHSIASRVRKVIEPDPEKPVFLQNKRGLDGGYWLEHCE